MRQKEICDRRKRKDREQEKERKMEDNGVVREKTKGRKSRWKWNERERDGERNRDTYVRLKFRYLNYQLFIQLFIAYITTAKLGEVFDVNMWSRKLLGNSKNYNEKLQSKKSTWNVRVQRNEWEIDEWRKGRISERKRYQK